MLWKLGSISKIGGRGVPDAPIPLQLPPMVHSIPSIRLCCSLYFKCGHRSHILCRQLIFNLILHAITFIDCTLRSWGGGVLAAVKKQIFPSSWPAELSSICIPNLIFKGTFRELCHVTLGWATRWQCHTESCISMVCSRMYWSDWSTVVSVPF